MYIRVLFIFVHAAFEIDIADRRDKSRSFSSNARQMRNGTVSITSGIISLFSVHRTEMTFAVFEFPVHTNFGQSSPFVYIYHVDPPQSLFREQEMNLNLLPPSANLSRFVFFIQVARDGLPFIISCYTSL